MPDQFTLEYIAYILSDEAKGLQRLWQPKIGDWFATAADVKWLVTAVRAWGIHAKNPKWVAEDARSQEEFLLPDSSLAWLPSLHQLLQIIEGAGCSWECDGEEWYIWTNQEGETYPLACQDRKQGDMLAAAKLAVRALTHD